MQVGFAAEAAAAISKLGISDKPNSMWLNGLPLSQQTPNPQARLGYGLQPEMQRMQVASKPFPFDYRALHSLLWIENL